MEKGIHIWLEDIKQSIDEIEDFLSEKREFSEFKKGFNESTSHHSTPTY
jgi:uncharacterized protein with HEPN domain